jgi:transcription antitermination factor NusG
MGYWAVARTLVRREAFAAARLEAGGFEAFAPRTTSGALFPGYIFIHVGDTWRAIDRTVGVLNLVKFGDAPARCPDAEIAKLQSQVDAHGFVRLPPPSKTNGRSIPIGARVRVAGGFSAIYLGMTVREREIVLMDILGRQARVTLRPGQTVELVDLVSTPRSR